MFIMFLKGTNLNILLKILIILINIYVTGDQSNYSIVDVIIGEHSPIDRCYDSINVIDVNASNDENVSNYSDYSFYL